MCIYDRMSYIVHIQMMVLAKISPFHSCFYDTKHTHTQANSHCRHTHTRTGTRVFYLFFIVVTRPGKIVVQVNSPERNAAVRGVIPAAARKYCFFFELFLLVLIYYIAAYYETYFSKIPTKVRLHRDFLKPD